MLTVGGSDLALALVVVFEDGDLVAFFDALQAVVVVPGQGATGLVVVVLPGDLVSRNANVAWASKNMSRLTLFFARNANVAWASKNMSRLTLFFAICGIVQHYVLWMLHCKH